MVYLEIVIWSNFAGGNWDFFKCSKAVGGISRDCIWSNFAGGNWDFFKSLGYLDQVVGKSEFMVIIEHQSQFAVVYSFSFRYRILE